jgi:uncharacterized protein YjiS (DUF1127 family)
MDYKHSLASSVKRQQKTRPANFAGKRPAGKGHAMTRFMTGPRTRAVGPFDLFATGRSVWNFVKLAAQRMRNRRAVMTLAEWDDRALRDIGLTRADVRLALGLPFHEDPSARLREWALERRLARLGESNAGAPPQLRVVGGRSRSTSASISR